MLAMGGPVAQAVQNNPVLNFIGYAQQAVAVLTETQSKVRVGVQLPVSFAASWADLLPCFAFLQDMIKGLVAGAVGSMKKEDRAMLELMQKCVADIKAVKVHFQSGVTVSLELNNFIPLSALPLGK